MKKILVIFMLLALFTGCGTMEKTTAGTSGTGPSASPSPSQTEPPMTKEADPSDDSLTVSETKSLSFFSKALGKEMPINVYLPEGYSENKKFPVLYFFHGMLDNEDTIIPLFSAADRLIDEGKIEPLVIAAPYIENSFGSNTSMELSFYDVPQMGVSLNEGMYEDYIYQDAMGYVRENFSVIASREGQYVGGISMGGYAALHMAFKHPESFCKVGGHSPAVYFDGGPRGWLYPDEQTMRENDPVYLATHGDLQDMQIYLDCGDRDSYGFQDSTKSLYELLIKENRTAELHINEGPHNMSYWNKHLEDYLLFYSPVKK